MADYHLHFLNHHRDAGGHVLDFQFDHGEIAFCTALHLHLRLPARREFLTATLSGTDVAEQFRHAEGGMS